MSLQNLPALNRHVALNHADPGLALNPALFQLPETILQFGSGVFLRAFADHLIDSANKQGLAAGRIVVVQSTDGARSRMLSAQDGLYTLNLQGLDAGNEVNQFGICSAISRALPASSAWPEILETAANPAMQTVISNTTEAGIVHDATDDLTANPPASFPGKLTAWLWARFNALGEKNSGVVILPCELIPENGRKLKQICLQLAEQGNLSDDFKSWLAQEIVFCDTLVDRIVSGNPPTEQAAGIAAKLGYQDPLLIVAEPYLQWAVAPDKDVNERLIFLQAHPGAFVCEDIVPFRDLKVSILNAAHSASVQLAYLAGFDHVIEFMRDSAGAAFMQKLVFEELVPVSTHPDANSYGQRVVERFNNPFLRHRLLDICRQAATKTRNRVLPGLYNWYKQQQTAPPATALGVAATLWFLCNNGSEAQANRHRMNYHVEDENLALLRQHWARHSDRPKDFVSATLADPKLWGSDLRDLPGFITAVSEWLTLILSSGAAAALRRLADSGKGAQRGS